MEKISVLDHGYVRLVDHLGNDLTVVNTARVSFDKESYFLSEKDQRLINYLVKHKHDSCFRHCVMTFEVYAPLMVGRQWWKHGIASSHVEDQHGWNESSRRYVTENEEFYIPAQCLVAPVNKKQGAGDPISDNTNLTFKTLLADHQQKGLGLYNQAMEAGIAPEQARLFLPAYGLYIRWRWTVSLNALMHFLDQRLDDHAQFEIRQYAQAIEPMVKEQYPMVYAAWVESRR